jgi:hypothetical protein
MIAKPALIPGSETWTLKEKDEKILEVQEIKFLRLLVDASRGDHLHNEATGSS